MEHNLEIYGNEGSIENWSEKLKLKEEESFLFYRFINNNEKKILLDIGIGTGRTSRFLKRKVNLVGLEPVSELIEQADSLEKRIIASATNLPFRESIFDYGVFSFNGMGHIYPDERRKDVLREIRRVLENGIFIYSIHNMRWLRDVWGKRGKGRRKIWKYKDNYYYVHLSYGNLISIFQYWEDEVEIQKELGFRNLYVTEDKNRPWLYYVVEKDVH